MPRLLLWTALALIAACGRAPAPGDALEYRAPDGSFTARAPGDWRVDESPGESRRASFFGPPGGPTPFSDLMGVYFHRSADPAADARFYVATQSGFGPVAAPGPDADAAALDRTGAREMPDIHTGRRVRTRTRVVAKVVPGGYFTLEHTWPAGQAPDPAFEELLKTFRPGLPAK